MSDDSIELVSLQAEEAIACRIRVNNKCAEAEPENVFDHLQRRQFRRLLKSYRSALRGLRTAGASKDFKSIQRARKTVRTSYAARFLAVVRATAKGRSSIPFSVLENWANEITLDKAFHEPVHIRPEPSKPGAWRPIALSGIRRKAQQLILRDMLLIEVGDNEYDSTVRGAGGEARVFDDMKLAIANGYIYWVAVDVRDFFPSLRPGHMAGLPLSKWQVGNLVFLPPDAPIRFIDQRYGVDLHEHTVFKGDDADLPDGYPFSMGSIRSMLKKVRQGLIQGDVLAPQIARTVLGREIQHALKKRDVAYASHLDDVLLGARSQSELEAGLEALTYRLKGHPAGPLELHDHAIRSIKDGVEHIGYRANVHASGQAHVRPAGKRFNRYRERLWDRLEASNAFHKLGLEAVAKNYEEQWYRSQTAWTKMKGPDGTDLSRAYVATESAIILNKFIFEEYIEEIGNWHEDDIDFELIGENDV